MEAFGDTSYVAIGQEPLYVIRDGLKIDVAKVVKQNDGRYTVEIISSFNNPTKGYGAGKTKKFRTEYTIEQSEGEWRVAQRGKLR